jgi:hypothetical protein
VKVHDYDLVGFDDFVELIGGSDDLDHFEARKHAPNMSSNPPQWLSEDIKNMAETETACEYCGISYLLLNKYEKLTAYLAETQKELSTLQVFKIKDRISLRNARIC